MNYKCTCPVCGGQLFYEKHVIVQYSKPISKITGKINNSVKPTENIWDTDCYEGLSCECGFNYNLCSLSQDGTTKGEDNICNSIVNDFLANNDLGDVLKSPKNFRHI